MYYLFPLLGILFFGTLMNFLLTVTGGNPRASIPNAFVFTFGKLVALYLATVLFHSGIAFIAVLFLAYYVLFMGVFRVSFFRGVRFLVMSTIISITVGLLLIEPFTDWFISAFY